jgi:hypothetical protein
MSKPLQIIFAHVSKLWKMLQKAARVHSPVIICLAMIEKDLGVRFTPTLPTVIYLQTIQINLYFKTILKLKLKY